MSASIGVSYAERRLRRGNERLSPGNTESGILVSRAPVSVV
jgi:hypothetical protein